MTKWLDQIDMMQINDLEKYLNKRGIKYIKEHNIGTMSEEIILKSVNNKWVITISRGPYGDETDGSLGYSDDEEDYDCVSVMKSIELLEKAGV